MYRLFSLSRRFGTSSRLSTTHAKPAGEQQQVADQVRVAPNPFLTPPALFAGLALVTLPLMAVWAVSPNHHEREIALLAVAAQREKERHELKELIERSEAHNAEQFRQLNHILLHIVANDRQTPMSAASWENMYRRVGSPDHETAS